MIAAVGVPLIWFGRALALHLGHDPAQRATLHFALQEASRFIYLLLYFPIVTEMRRGRGWSVARIWLAPLLALTVLTLGLLVAYAVFRDGFTAAVTSGPGGGDLGPIEGAIGLNASGQFQVFLTSDVLLLPGFAWLLAGVITHGAGRRNIAAAALLLSTAYLTYARGIWLGVCVICGAVAFAVWTPALWAGLRRSVIVLAGLVATVLLLLSADPGLAPSAVRWLTAGDLSTAVRVQQAPELLSAVARDPLFGSGLGATLPSGYIRSPVAPWSFELGYLQLLFELGIIGSAMLALPLALALRQAARGLRSVGRGGNPILLAALGGCAAFAITCASNPYLLASPGMLTYAIVLAIAETAVLAGGSSGAVRAGRSPPSPRRLGSNTVGAAIDQAAASRSRMLAGVLAALAVLQFMPATRRVTRRRAARDPAAGPRAGRPVEPVGRAAAASPGRLWLASSWDRGGPMVAFVVAEDAGRLAVQPEPLAPGRAARARPATIRAGVSPGGSILGVSVGVWDGARALFVVSQSGGALLDEAVALDGSGRVLARGRVLIGRVAAGTRRYASIDLGPHGVPSLFVVQRRADHLSISVRPGFPVSDAPSITQDGRLPYAAAADSLPVIAAVDSRGADVALFSPLPARAGSRTGAALHVIAAVRSFRSFGTQETLPVALPAAARSLGIAYDAGAPVLVVLDAVRGRAVVHGLWDGADVRDERGTLTPR